MNSSIMNNGLAILHANQGENNADKHYGAYENYNNTVPLKHLPEVTAVPVPNNLVCLSSDISFTLIRENANIEPLLMQSSMTVHMSLSSGGEGVLISIRDCTY